MSEYPLILIDKIDFSYPNGTLALNKVSLNIDKGEFIAIMGQNGAGKTTLIRTLNGLIRPNWGFIYINGENIETKTIATLSQKVGIIFQNPSHQLFSNTIEDEIKFSLKSFNLTKEELTSKVDEILRDFGLERYRDRSPLNLSGGESKKLAIASIICRDPDILIFDEPTLGQDAKEIEFFIRMLNNERRSGKTIIIVTHNIEFTYEFIPRTILMAEGKIIADGPTLEVLTNKKLIQKGSPVLPQIHQFKEELIKIGLDLPGNAFSENQLISIIDNYLNRNVK